LVGALDGAWARYRHNPEPANRNAAYMDDGAIRLLISSHPLEVRYWFQHPTLAGQGPHFEEQALCDPEAPWVAHPCRKRANRHRQLENIGCEGSAAFTEHYNPILAVLLRGTFAYPQNSFVRGS
jgi:hypothetical protein